MRITVLVLLAFSSLLGSSKGLHVRYVAHVPEGLSEEQLALIPEYWDLRMTDEGFRMEEVGGAKRVWVGTSDSESFHILFELFGHRIALLEPCAEPASWRKGTAPAPPLPQFDAASPVIAGEEAAAYEWEGQGVWLTAARSEAPCLWGFPRLPLAFPLPESISVWMVAESIGAFEGDVDCGVPQGYEQASTEELGRLLPDLKLAE